MYDDVKDEFDPFQCAYKDKCGTDDAISTVVHLVLKHLDQLQAYARVLFVDFSSAFDTIQPFVLLEKMKAIKANHFIIKWYHFFDQEITDCSSQSDPLPLYNHKHGRPLGYVSSPLLYTLYANNRTSTNPVTSLTNLQMILQFSAFCLPIATLTCTSMR